jgi:zona occludens toxin (predicted ATPase)
MGWTQKIEYVDAEVVLPTPVKKQVWDPDTQSFVPMTLYKRNHVLSNEETDWLRKTYGLDGVYKNGRYWDYSRAGNFIVMDEKVFMWFEMKWRNK